ncbi:unnamed protein product [Gongylonema pulchrum]|uniref:SSD domain-containing protein n=1 Tax=Gongylonema pulchrum TaxID=637853 RepID=A0A3P6Q840_9BILA|nr:unnamed protein product [Gongylonema pulchrum]
MQILVNRKDGGNLMNENDLDELMAMHRFVVNNVTIDDGTSTGLSYRDICGIYCNDSNNIVLSFIQVNLHLPNGRKVAKDFESQLRTLFSSATIESQNLMYALLSRDREMEEQRKITLVALPFLGLTGLVLTAFMIISLINFPLRKSQHIEAVFAVVSPSMALVTSGGVLWGLGFPFSNILTVVPFLVVTIGVDDAFLILAAWRHSNPAVADLKARMGETMMRSGASVTVTSLTDMTFFSAIVVYCGRRKMRQANEKRCYKEVRRCILSVSTSIKRPYGIQSTTSSSSILNRLWGKASCSSSNKVYCVGVGVTKYSLSNGDTQPRIAESKQQSSMLQLYIHFLHSPFIKCATVAVFVAHIAVSSYLCTKVNTDFDMENLYMKDSPLNAISRQMQRFVLSEAFVVNFALHPMPNFADAFIRDKFDQLIEELETIPRYGMGPDGTVLWTRDFADVSSSSSCFIIPSSTSDKNRSACSQSFNCGLPHFLKPFLNL